MYTNMSNSTLGISRFVPFTCGIDNFLQCRIAVWLWKICPIILLIFGTIGNFLNIIVLTRTRIRKFPNTMLLLFLSVSDCTFLWTVSVRYTLLIYKDIDIKDLSIFNCVMQDWITYTSADFSLWLLVFLTLERVIYTKWPMIARSKITTKTTMCASIVLLISMSLFCCPYLFVFKLEDIHTESNTGRKCVFVSQWAKRFKTVTWRRLSYICMNVIPIILVMLGNTVIVFLLKQHNKRLRRIPNSQTGTTASSQRQKSVTRMLFILSTFYILTTAPHSIYALIWVEAAKSPTPRRFANIQLTYAVTTIVLFCNSTFNFYLYFINGSNFKKEWKEIVSQVRTNIINTCTSSIPNLNINIPQSPDESTLTTTITTSRVDTTTRQSSNTTFISSRASQQVMNRFDRFAQDNESTPTENRKENVNVAGCKSSSPADSFRSPAKENRKTNN